MLELQGFNMRRHSEVKKDGTSRIQHVCVCVCAFFGVLSDMESSVGWFCRHVGSHVFVCLKHRIVGAVMASICLPCFMLVDFHACGPVACGSSEAFEL